MKVYAKALTIKEASQLVRSMKTPSKIEQRINAIKRFSSASESNNKFQLLGKLITELLAIFPIAMPKEYLIDKGVKELGLQGEFIEEVIENLNKSGLILVNKFNNKYILKFPSLPFSAMNGKLYVSQPDLKQKYDSKRKNQNK
ncbi:MAG: hypothetical protein ACTSWX_00610 [Promethearchaeota archaeon]